MPKYQESVCYFYDDLHYSGGRIHRALKTKVKSTGAATLRKLAEWVCWAYPPTQATRKYFKQTIRFYPETNARDYERKQLTRKELEELSKLVEEVKLEKLLEGAGVK